MIYIYLYFGVGAILVALAFFIIWIAGNERAAAQPDPQRYRRRMAMTDARKKSRNHGVGYDIFSFLVLVAVVTPVWPYFIAWAASRLWSESGTGALKKGSRAAFESQASNEQLSSRQPKGVQGDNDCSTLLPGHGRKRANLDWNYLKNHPDAHRMIGSIKMAEGPDCLFVLIDPRGNIVLLDTSVHPVKTISNWVRKWVFNGSRLSTDIFRRLQLQAGKIRAWLCRVFD